VRKVMTIVGTRPELIKMSRVIAELDRHTNHVLVHTGQNFDYELNRVFFEDMGIRDPDHFLGVAADSAAQAIARVIEKADAVMEQEKPEALLLYGDTNSCLAVIPAKRRKIPVFHMEAGNRCFDQRVPEELNRKVLDHLSDFNLVLTEHARRYLIAEGIRPETIIKTGSHMHEVLQHYRARIDASDVLQRLGLVRDGYFLVSAHREENVDSENNLRHLLETLNALARKYEKTVVVSTHPRTRKRLDAFGTKEMDQRVQFMKPFGFTDYIRLQMEAACVLSDSGSLTEEASLLNLPAVALRHTHERPEGMDKGTLMMAGLRSDRVLDAVRVVLAQHDRNRRVIPAVDDYENGPASAQMVRVVLSYIDYINRTVWSSPE
jgi:UDP-N-acetylglucosamine 2-epimerase